MRISKRDKDTMLLTSSTGDQVYIITYNYCLRKKLEAFAAKHPEDCRFMKCTKEGCATFAIRKSCVSIKFTGLTE